MRCAVYVRVSTNKEEQKASLKYQKELIYRYIEDKGWDIYDFYIDVQTGTTSKRENLQKMIEDAKDKKFDVILAKELSRLARNGTLSYKIRDLCNDEGIHIITLDNAINTLKGETHLFGLFAWLYEQESQNTSNRVKDTLRTRAKKGLFHGSNPPYGYEVRDGKLYISSDDTPNIVRRIYNEYLSGSGRDKIARRLYNEGIPTPAEVAGKKNAGDKWNDSTLRLILTNPHYAGDLVLGRETSVSVTSSKRKKVEKENQIIHKDAHEPIISREVFDAVQQQMKIRTKFITAPKKHLFTNILYCADCGKGMWWRSNRKGYVCGNYARHGKKACSHHAIREKFLIDTISADIQELVEHINKDHYLKQLENESTKSKQSLQRQIVKLDKQIDSIKDRKRKYINLLAEEIISKEDYRESVEVNNIEIDNLIEEKNVLLKGLENKQTVDNIEQLKQKLQQFLNSDELTPEILHRFVNRVEVMSDGKPIIHYSFTAPKIK